LTRLSKIETALGIEAEFFLGHKSTTVGLAGTRLDVYLCRGVSIA